LTFEVLGFKDAQPKFSNQFSSPVSLALTMSGSKQHRTTHQIIHHVFEHSQSSVIARLYAVLMFAKCL